MNPWQHLRHVKTDVIYLHKASRVLYACYYSSHKNVCSVVYFYVVFITWRVYSCLSAVLSAWGWAVDVEFAFQHLQWTTMGPAVGGLDIFTRRINDKSPVAWYGTPWSGQPVKWNCFTSRTSLKPLCEHRLKNTPWTFSHEHTLTFLLKLIRTHLHI